MTTPEEVYWRARRSGESEGAALRRIRQEFSLSLADAQRVAAAARLYIDLEYYAGMRARGASDLELASHAVREGYDYNAIWKMLVEVCGMSWVEAKRVEESARDEIRR